MFSSARLFCAIFLGVLPLASLAQTPVISQLETFDVTTNQRTIVLRDTVRFEAPNWTKDGKHLIINQQGRLYRVDLAGGTRSVIETGGAINCNNDHGISPDGKWLVISNNDNVPSQSGSVSKVYVLPIGGGTPRLITPQGPSYWHGWSPDGQTLAYVAERTTADGTRDYDIYTLPVNAGAQPPAETRLTTAKGLDDGPDYSPDGKHIYFNSMRSGKMEVWRMNADGTAPKQLTNDAHSNWFPHPSPDGRWLLFISYLDDQGSAHPADKAVMLRLMNLKTGQLRELCRFLGGQGTINVPNWSPDSRQFGFVTYPER